MKTTLDLQDDLLMEAKQLALRRKTTLRAIVEGALRRELQPAVEMENPDPQRLEVGPLGLLVLKAKPGSAAAKCVELQQVAELCEDEDFQYALKLRGS
jgi:hypothetical protein